MPANSNPNYRLPVRWPIIESAYSHVALKDFQGTYFRDPLKDYLRHCVQSHLQKPLFKSTDIWWMSVLKCRASKNRFRRDIKVFVLFSASISLRKRRLITIYRDEPDYWNTSKLLKAFHVYICVYVLGVCVYICIVLWRRVLSRMINYICDMKKFCSDAR